MRRITILLAALGALLLLPAASAFALGTMSVNIEGTGKGEFNSTAGYEGSGFLSGEPPIVCKYNSPGPKTGTCETELQEAEPGFYAIVGNILPSAGSELTDVIVEEGGVNPVSSIASGKEPCAQAPPEATEYEYVTECIFYDDTFTGEGNVAVTFVFDKCKEGSEAPSCASKGPTNLGTLSVSKSGSGQGAVASKPKGIKCGNTCDTAEASLYKESSVVLTAKAAVTAGSTFTGWSGCDSETKSSTEGTCTVKMSATESVVASFGGTGKAILNPQVLTVSKGGEGKGAVKASGLACEADCTETKVQYTGGEGKKLPAVVTLSQLPAPGSSFSGWSGCESEVEGKCVVTMSSAQSVTASYAKLPAATLTVNKAGSGQGAVASKPKGIKCGNTCPTATASLYEGAVVVLTAKAAVTAGSTFTGWSAGCTSETKSSTEGTCTVTLSTSKTITAEFGGTKKAILNPQTLTLTKAGSGYGTVKASGLACEPACTTTQVQYTGGEGKKLPATVVLKAISAPGSKAVQWSGCDSIDGEGNCVVTTSEAKNVTASFDELE